MLNIVPKDEIVFTKQSNGRICGEIELCNETEDTIIFKVKTTSPGKFFVQSRAGVLINGARKSIRVQLQSNKHVNTSLMKAKFLILSVVLDQKFGEADDINILDIFKYASDVKQNQLVYCFTSLLTSHTNKTDIQHSNDVALNPSLPIQYSVPLDQLQTLIRINRCLQLATICISLVLIAGIIYILKILLQESKDCVNNIFPIK